MRQPICRWKVSRVPWDELEGKLNDIEQAGGEVYGLYPATVPAKGRASADSPAEGFVVVSFTRGAGPSE